MARASSRLDPAALKADLRRRILAQRDALDPETHARLSAAIFDRIGAMPVVRAAHGVLAYVSFGSEPLTLPFLRAVLESGRTLALPRIDRATRQLALYRVDDLDEQLEPGPWGILEPMPLRCRPAEAGELDLVLMPGVAFDPRGGRVGYGAGYYDRLLAGWPAPRPGLVAGAFDLQVVPEVPVLPDDHRVDHVVTESRQYPESPNHPTEER